MSAVNSHEDSPIEHPTVWMLVFLSVLPGAKDGQRFAIRNSLQSSQQFIQPRQSKFLCVHDIRDSTHAMV